MNTGLLFAVVNLATFGSTLKAATVGRRLGTVRAIVAVRAAQGVLLVPMALAPAFWEAGTVDLVRMVIQRVGLPLRQSFTQAALSNLPAQGTQAGSQVLAGYLFDEVAMAAPLLLAGVLQAVNAITYSLLFLTMSGRTEEEKTSSEEAAPQAVGRPKAGREGP